MAIPRPDVEQSDEPTADEVREKVIECLRGEYGPDWESTALATLTDDEPVEITVHARGDDIEGAVSRLKDADAALHVVAVGSEGFTDAQFSDGAGDRKQARIRRLNDEAMEWAVERRERMADHDDIGDYTPEERAVLALGTSIQRRMNPLAALLGGR